MKKIEIQSGAKVGERITKLISGVSATATELHAIMVQCAMHAYVHGDTGLIKRLVQEVQDNQDAKLKGAAILNVVGIKFWFGTFCAITERNGEYKLADKDGQAYLKYMEANVAAFGNPDPPEQRSGNRAFWITAGDEHPFWDMDDVKKAQRLTIRPFGMDAAIKAVLGLEKKLDDAITNGLIPEESIELTRELVGLISKQARDFRNANAGAILQEGENIAKLKLVASEEVKEAVIEELPEGDEAAAPVVGGDVTEGLAQDQVVNEQVIDGKEPKVA